MKLFVLGSGTCIPSVRRGSSGYFLNTGRSKIILDCGNGTTWKLEKLGISYLEIDHIFITHLHPDHTSDLIPFLFATKYPFKTKRRKTLNVHGPSGFKYFFEQLAKTYNGWIEPECLEINELERNHYEFNDFMFYCMQTPHTENSVAFKIESDAKTIVYSGDTDYFESFAEFSKNCDVLLIECSLPDEYKAKGHLTPSEIIKIANLSKPKKIILTHIYPACDEPEIFDRIKKNCKAEVVVAEDLMEIDI